jgi:hypothetical protein
MATVILSDMAPTDPTASGNPVPMNKVAALQLYTQALSGKLG